MRSSIFNNEGPSRPMNSSNRSKAPIKKSKSSSPYISTPNTPNISEKNNGSMNDNYNKLKHISWSLDDLVSSYQDKGFLPPILSPTIPIDGPEINPMESQKLLRSPAGDQIKKGSTIDSEDEDSEDYFQHKARVKRRIKSRNRDFIVDSGEEDNIPLSMLSPTLPSLFDKEKEKPIEKKPPITTGGGSANGSRNGSAGLNGTRIRWINKHDASTPKFLLRITFDKNRQKKLDIPQSDDGSTGLGIITDSKEKRELKEKREEKDRREIKGRIREEKEKKEEREKKERAKEEKEKREREKLKEDREKERIKERDSQEKLAKEREQLSARVKQQEDREREFREKEREAKERDRDEAARLKQSNERALREKEKEMMNQFKKEKEAYEKELQEREKKIREAEKSLQSKEKERSNKPSASVSGELSYEQQKKREQIKQLNKDVIMKEQNRSRESRITLPSPSLPSIPVHHKWTPTQRDEMKHQLQAKKAHWLQLSKAAKQKADTLRGSHDLLGIIMQVDALILRMISYDYDERAKIVTEVLPSERSWKILVQDIVQLIKEIDGVTQTLKDKNLLEFLKILVCILFQVKAVVLKRINSILTKVIQSYINKNTERGELNGKIIELQQLTIANNSQIVENFMNSRPSYVNAIIPIKFPVTWFKKSTDLEQAQQDYILDNCRHNIKPSNQVYYLPIGVYSNMNEITCFLHNILHEFIDIFNKFIRPAEPIKYQLQCGQ